MSAAFAFLPTQTNAGQLKTVFVYPFYNPVTHQILNIKNITFHQEPQPLLIALHSNQGKHLKLNRTSKYRFNIFSRRIYDNYFIISLIFIHMINIFLRRKYDNHFIYIIFNYCYSYEKYFPMQNKAAFVAYDNGPSYNPDGWTGKHFSRHNRGPIKRPR